MNETQEDMLKHGEADLLLFVRLNMGVVQGQAQGTIITSSSGLGYSSNIKSHEKTKAQRQLWAGVKNVIGGTKFDVVTTQLTIQLRKQNMKKNQNNSILVCYIFLQKKEEYFFGEMFNPRDVQELYQIKLEQISLLKSEEVIKETEG